MWYPHIDGLCQDRTIIVNGQESTTAQANLSDLVADISSE